MRGHRGHAPTAGETQLPPASSQSWVGDRSSPLSLLSKRSQHPFLLQRYLILPELRLSRKSGRSSVFETREGKPQLPVRNGKGGRDLEKEAKLKSQRVARPTGLINKQEIRVALDFLAWELGRIHSPRQRGPRSHREDASAPGTLATCED